MGVHMASVDTNPAPDMATRQSHHTGTSLTGSAPRPPAHPGFQRAGGIPWSAISVQPASPLRAWRSRISWSFRCQATPTARPSPYWQFSLLPSPGARSLAARLLLASVLISFFIERPRFAWDVHSVGQVVGFVVLQLVGAGIGVLASEAAVRQRRLVSARAEAEAGRRRLDEIFAQLPALVAVLQGARPYA